MLGFEWLIKPWYLIIGVFFIIRLPVDLLPSITYPRIGLRIEAPGIS
ncbi:MAG: efflux RND transporter permease subunit, partial [Sphaerospermopsis sp. SIO1G2]|nr:efflux RND transporter permease subunit [Sphaerospermopsis sp. SIO1G2]